MRVCKEVEGENNGAREVVERDTRRKIVMNVLFIFLYIFYKEFFLLTNKEKKVKEKKLSPSFLF